MGRTILAAVLGILGILALGWIVMGNEFFLYKFFAPRQEAVRRQVFEQTKSYNQGMIQELQNMQFQYEQANEQHKAALASIILHRAADFPPESLPPDLDRFIRSLRSQR